MSCAQVKADDIGCESRFGEHTALYVWSDALRSQNVSSILELAQVQDVDRLLLSIGKGAPIEKVDTLKARARQSGITTEFLLAPNYWVRSGDLEDVRSRIKGIDLEGSPLHLNIEPHAYDDFDQREEEYLRRYLEVLRETRKVIGDSRLTVSVPLFWPDSTYRDIAPIVDRAYFMAYGEREPRERAEQVREVSHHFALKQRVIALRPEDYSDLSALNQSVSALGDTVETGQFALHDFESFVRLVGNDGNPPIASNDAFSSVEDQVLTAQAPGVLGNDCDLDGDSLSASVASSPSNGSLTLGKDGSFEYSPEKGFAGIEEFVYKVSDGDSTDAATVTVNVEAIFVTISGSVAYPREGENGLTDGRPLSGVPVKVSAVSGDTAAMDTTDSDGNFSVDVRTGEYVVEPQIDRDIPSGEINATDANRTVGGYVGTSPFLDDFQKEVADVNNSDNANATDALNMAFFFNDPEGTTFEASDWATTADTADVTDGGDANVSVLAAAHGDADLSGAEQSGGSAVATANGASPSAELERESDLRGVEREKTFEVPVRLDDAATVGSYSLEIEFPADKVSFRGVAETDRNVMSTAEEGAVRLSWFDQSGDQPMKLGSGASLVTLRFSAVGGVEKGTAFTLEVTASELAGPDAQPLTSTRLSVEGTEIGSVLPDKFALDGSYPNPVLGGQATIEMDLPARTDVTVEIYNTLGQRVQTIERPVAAGTGQTLQVDASRLASGQYFYRVRADLEGGAAEEFGRITILQ